MGRKILPIITDRPTPILDRIRGKKDDDPEDDNPEPDEKSIDDKIDELIDECADDVKKTETKFKESTGEFFEVDVSDKVSRKYIKNTIKGLLGKLED